MAHDPAALYTAFAARDARFDGVFYVGVTSTGIYCRPVCTAKTPRAANCRFLDSAAAAEKAGFRPCLRCRPELAPGNAPVDDRRRIASLVAQRIAEGMLDDGAGLEQVARRFGWSSRQIRRIVQRELGVSPVELVQTRRLLLAKQLLTETTLPIAQVAFASGFASLRRFNDSFGSRYGMAPSRFRRAAASDDAPAAAHKLRLQLAYRPPFDWSSLLAFLEARTLAGVEAVAGGVYRRTVQLGPHAGAVSIANEPARNALVVELDASLTPVLPALLGRLRHLFDLDARPDVIAEHLGRDRVLAAAVARNPGLRVPGAFDGFELAVRAVLGQQVSVKAATTLAGRFIGRFGAPLPEAGDGLTSLAPTPARIAGETVDSIASLGIVAARARSILHIAEAMAADRLRLDAGASPDDTIARLVAIPGIGPWTANYIAMRALRWPDAFPKEDVVLRRRMGGLTPVRAARASEAWRPWRSYATMHLWNSAVAP